MKFLSGAICSAQTGRSFHRNNERSTCSLRNGTSSGTRPVEAMAAAQLRLPWCSRHHVTRVRQEEIWSECGAERERTSTAAS